jgi:Fe-S-cluster containining protein
MLQARGKVRRFIQSTFRPKRTAEMMSHRSGECNRCGACCKILFQCPFLFTDDDGQYSCRIYEKRFTQCRLYPIQAKDLREVPECSYTFDNAPDPAKSNTARDEAGRPEPVPAGK